MRQVFLSIFLNIIVLVLLNSIIIIALIFITFFVVYYCSEVNHMRNFLSLRRGYLQFN